MSIKFDRTNNGPEFSLKSFYASKGVLHQTTCVATPQQNAVVETKHQYLLNATRALLFQANVPKIFWSFAVSYDAFIINRIPTPVLDNQAPFELLYNKPLDLSMLRVFGSLCFASTLSHNRSKLDSIARKCISLGYKLGTKGYILFDLQTRETFVSRQVIFHESSFLFHSLSHNLDHEHESTTLSSVLLLEQHTMHQPDYAPPFIPKLTLLHLL